MSEEGSVPRGTLLANPADEGECISGGGGIYRWSQDCLLLASLLAPVTGVASIQSPSISIRLSSQSEWFDWLSM